MVLFPFPFSHQQNNDKKLKIKKHWQKNQRRQSGNHRKLWAFTYWCEKAWRIHLLAACHRSKNAICYKLHVIYQFLLLEITNAERDKARKKYESQREMVKETVAFGRHVDGPPKKVYIPPPSRTFESSGFDSGKHAFYPKTFFFVNLKSESWYFCEKFVQ